MESPKTLKINENQWKSMKMNENSEGTGRIAGSDKQILAEGFVQRYLTISYGFAQS